MKNLLCGVALLATSFLLLPNEANAASLPNTALLAIPGGSGGAEQIHWRPYRHCHGPRWERHCHGGRFFDGDRRRHGKWDRDDRRDGDGRRGRRDSD